MPATALTTHYLFDPARRIWQPKGGIVQDNDANPAESNLLTAVQNCSDCSVLSREIQQLITDSETQHQLGRQRSNILRPLNTILRHARVLEIGAGCGAITRYLGETAAAVLALEASPRQAEIAAARCADLDNVAVLISDIDHFQTAERFDVIVLIDPEGLSADVLAKTQALLAPDGHLILATDNQLGLKYWCGAADLHSGQSMQGINNLNPDNARSFGSHIIHNMLYQAGYAAMDLLVPFPDHRAASTVLQPSAIDGENATNLAIELARGSIAGDPQLRDLPLHALPELAIKPIIENGFLPQFGNSFVMVARQTAMLPLDANRNVIAWYMATSRNPAYAKMLTFTRDGGDITVNKQALGAASTQNPLNFHLQPEPYQPGSLWSSELSSIVARPGWTVHNIAEWLNTWLDALTSATALDDVATDQSLAGRWLDATPFNMAVDKNGQARFFDLEWEASEQITLGYLTFRALLHSLQRLVGIAPMGEGTPITILPLILRVMELCNLPTTAAQIDDYLQQESTLQQQVLDRPLAITVAALESQMLCFLATNQQYLSLQEKYIAAKNKLAVTALPAKDKANLYDTKSDDYIGEIHRLHAVLEDQKLRFEILQAEREREIAQYDLRFQLLQQKLDTSKQERSEIEAAYRRIETSRQQEEAACAHQYQLLEHNIDTLTHSYSWRLTKPLRLLHYLLRKR